MKCIDCSLYKFDGKEFHCPATPWHDATDGMFQTPGEGECPHAKWYNKQKEAQHEPKTRSCQQHKA